MFQQLCRCENLLGTGAHPEILRQVHPTYSSARVDQELGGTSNVAAILSHALVHQIVRANGLRVGIGEKEKGVAGFLRVIARDLTVVGADGYRADSRLIELVQVLLDTP